MIAPFIVTSGQGYHFGRGGDTPSWFLPVLGLTVIACCILGYLLIREKK